MFNVHKTTQPSHLFIYRSDEAVLSSVATLHFSSFFKAVEKVAQLPRSQGEFKTLWIHQNPEPLRSRPTESFSTYSCFRGHSQHSVSHHPVMLKWGSDFFFLPITSLYSSPYSAGIFDIWWKSWLFFFFFFVRLWLNIREGIRDNHTANGSGYFISSRHTWSEGNSVWHSLFYRSRDTELTLVKEEEAIIS